MRAPARGFGFPHHVTPFRTLLVLSAGECCTLTMTILLQLIASAQVTSAGTNQTPPPQLWHRSDGFNYGVAAFLGLQPTLFSFHRASRHPKFGDFRLLYPRPHALCQTTLQHP